MHLLDLHQALGRSNSALNDAFSACDSNDFVSALSSLSVASLSVDSLTEYAVKGLRDAGWPWREIAPLLGCSTANAHRRFAHVDPPVSAGHYRRRGNPKGSKK